MAKKKAARKPTRTRKKTTKRTTRNLLATVCREVFAARLELAADSPAARFSKGLDHDPTAGVFAVRNASHLQGDANHLGNIVARRSRPDRFRLRIDRKGRELIERVGN